MTQTEERAAAQCRLLEFGFLGIGASWKLAAKRENCLVSLYKLVQ